VKVLIVDPDAARAAGVAEALAGSGATTAVASSASFALTMLEWNRQDVIISRAQVGDMDAREFCAMVRSDPSTAGVRFVLIARDVTPAQMTEHRIDLVIPEGLIGHAIVTRVMHLMRREASAARTAPPPAPPPAPTIPVAPPSIEVPRPPDISWLPPLPAAVDPVPEPVAAPAAVDTTAIDASPPAECWAPAVAEPAAVEPPLPTPAGGAAPPPPSLSELDAVGLNGATRTFQGALGALALEELAQALAAGGKTGRLLLVLGTGGGMIAFDGGRIVHAEIGNTTGETAFQSLVAASRRERGGKFCFIPSASRDLVHVPETITRRVADLLVGAAGGIDEER
jgi:CheY-like chemotaxis protein